MSIQKYHLRPLEIRSPQKPKPLSFAVRKVAEDFELRMARTPLDRQRIFDRLKNQAAHELARLIFENCKFFDVSDVMSNDMKLQLELTINDRGTYENWLPITEQQGKAEGRKQAVIEMVESLPYGLADAAAEFYE